MVVADRRYVVCQNPDEARKDFEAREAIVAKLQKLFAEQGPKAVIGNRGFARFVKIRRGSVTIDDAAIQWDARLDGKLVLRTNTDLSTEELALAYKSLWRVERTFREEKSTLEVRPIYHHRDDTSIGHLVASFLALRLEVDLQRQLDERGVDVSWPDLMRDLDQVRAVVVDLDGKRFRLRTVMVGCAHHAFATAGVRPPPVATLVGDSPPGRLMDGSGVVPNSFWVSPKSLTSRRFILETVENQPNGIFAVISIFRQGIAPGWPRYLKLVGNAHGLSIFLIERAWTHV